MDVKELIKIGKEIMKMLHERGIKMEDYQYLPMVEEFDIMKSMGHKTTYIAAHLAEKYGGTKSLHGTVKKEQWLYVYRP